MVISIIFCAYIFALVISQLQLAPKLADYLAELGITAGALVGILFIVLLILGLFLESSSLKVLTLPIIYPLAMTLGINSLWLGIFYQFNGEIGLLTPPVGLNLFVISGITGISLTTIVRGTIPFVLMMMLTLLIIYFYPELVTWLPSTRG